MQAHITRRRPESEFTNVGPTVLLVKVGRAGRAGMGGVVVRAVGRRAASVGGGGGCVSRGEGGRPCRPSSIGVVSRFPGPMGLVLGGSGIPGATLGHAYAQHC